MRSGHQAQLQDGRQGRSAETGPPGFRKRYSSVARFVQMTIDISRSEKAYFDVFFEETIKKGTLPFTIPDPTTDGWPIGTADGTPIVTADGTPIVLSTTWLCLFADMPAETIPGGNRFRYAFTLAVMP
ncbi:hypothetical protein [Pseudoruegeria sp. HB172150]|uniref:hypothetical protein n=1 Tax=Pseudoruegeria sp. HB172150 TaxID=2721164 RepID=UPI0020A681DD|nr:hypothetical protein [Pseudoruegeria sp. HB172150]